MEYKDYLYKDLIKEYKQLVEVVYQQKIYRIKYIMQIEQIEEELERRASKVV